MTHSSSGSTRREFLSRTLAGLAAGVSLPAFAPLTYASAIRRLSSFDAQALPLLKELTLDQKVGQMTQPDQIYLASIDDIEKYYLGSVLSGGGAGPKSGNDAKSWANMVDGFQTSALRTNPRIPLIYGVDAVHGHNNVTGATMFPHNIGQGCARDAKLVEAMARITAEEVRATGINWAFAPCVAVPQDIRWGRSYEGYSENPDIVKMLGEAAVRGLQTDNLANPLAVAACSKHYVADGATAFGTGHETGGPGSPHTPLDQGDARIDEATLRKVHLPGYLTTVKAGVATIMPSYSSWNGVHCSASKFLLTDLIKTEIGFEGFLISDYGALQELPGSYKEQIATSINAGMDMVMVPQHYVEFIRLLKQNVQEGKIPLSRIDDAVTRILRVKFALGLMDPRRNQLADRGLQSNFGSASHRMVAREIVRKSLVILKNDSKMLPLARNAAHIHVAGVAADDIGIQCGGWTISWQGSKGATTTGTTLLGSLRKVVSSASRVTTSADGTGAAGATVAIAVIGEPPYAETNGDRKDLHLSKEDVAIVQNLKKSGVPVVAIIYSGRPVILDGILDHADAVIAAWLPGSEGDGLTDVLFGAHKPTGKLSFTWPAGDSTSFHLGDAGYKTLFPRDYGLSFG
jgi:beta-glucosidase